MDEQGFPVHLVERQDKLGGNLNNIRYFVSANGSTRPSTDLDVLSRAQGVNASVIGWRDEEARLLAERAGYR